MAEPDDPVFQLAEPVVAALRGDLPDVSERVVAAIIAEVPSYRRAFAGPMGETIRGAVALALAGFLDRVAGQVRRSGERTRTAVHNGAYDLGRGEARAGRTMDALLSAYRVGARVAWRGMSTSAVAAGLRADQVVTYAELVFAYIDELSAASVAGHSDELEITGRVQQRLRERLARLLLTDAPADAVLAAARRADWDLPETLTAVLLPPAQLRAAITALGTPGARALVLEEDLPEPATDDLVALLVPDASRGVLRGVLRDRDAVLGPTLERAEVVASYRRAVRAAAAGVRDGRLVDTDDHLAQLLLAADPLARADLRSRALAPLAGETESSREKLAETLRAWLLCGGRRDDVAALLYVHPQTVRYRMTRIRELFGEALTDPDRVLELVLALG
ncbi:MAG: PucR family transcriptional regulator [Marmoricola sp.]